MRQAYGEECDGLLEKKKNVVLKNRSKVGEFGKIGKSTHTYSRLIVLEPVLTFASLSRLLALGMSLVCQTPGQNHTSIIGLGEA